MKKRKSINWKRECADAKADLANVDQELTQARTHIKILEDRIHAHGVALDAEQRRFVDHSLKLNEEIERLTGLVGQPVRHRLPDTRRAVTHKFNIGGHEGYMIVGMFEDGKPGELFIAMAKEGSTIGGLMDTIGTLTSLSLQYGVSVETLARKFAHQRFEPSGYTSNQEIKMASSIIDYVFRWLEIYFVSAQQVLPPVEPKEEQLALPSPS